jgi:hypothetical protein
MSPTLIAIEIILVALAVAIFLRAWRRARAEQARRKLWPAMDFSKVGTEIQVPPASIDGLRGFSTSFDADTVRPFLERIGPFIESGFGPAQIDQVAQSLTALAPDQEQKFEFPIRYAGKDARLAVQIVMDDLQAPDLYFFSPPALTRQIASEMARFAKDRGM